MALTSSQLPLNGRSSNSLSSNRKLRIKHEKNSLKLKGRAIEAALLPEYRQEFAERLFSLPNISSLIFRPLQGQVTLDLTLPKEKLKDFVSLLGSAMQEPRPTQFRLANSVWLTEQLHPSRIELFRVGTELSFWRIEKVEPNLYYLDHPILALKPEYRKIVRLALAALPGVSCLPPRPWSRGRIEVEVQGMDIDAGSLLDVIDPALLEEPEKPSALHHERSVHRVLHSHHDKLVNANVILAPIADYLFPPLGIINVVLVWLINRVHLQPAWADLRKGRANLHLLYFTIGGLTLISFSFFSAAVMYWLMSFWHRQTKALREHFEDDFLSRYQRYPRRVWTESGSVTVQSRLAELPQEAVLVLRAGDYVPADGVVLSGSATVDERWLIGSPGLSAKGSGAPIYRSTEIVEGSLRMKFQNGSNHVCSATRIADWYENEWRCRGWELPSPSQEFATKAVLPTLLLGLLAGGRDGIGTMKAVIRPDFYSGPESATEFLDLASAFNAAGDGIVIYGASSLEPLLNIDCLIIDDSVSWTMPDSSQFNAAEFARLIKGYGVTEVVYLADKSDRLGMDLGCDIVQLGYVVEAKRAFIQHRQAMSDRVAYIGDCISHSTVAAEADLAISVAQVPFLQPLPRYPFILSPDLSKILRLFALAQQSKEMFSTSTRVALVPNLVAMFSGFYLGTHLSTSVAITNLGTAVNYVRGASILELSR